MNKKAVTTAFNSVIPVAHSGFQVAYDISWAIFIESVKSFAERSAAVNTGWSFVPSTSYVYVPE